MKDEPASEDLEEKGISILEFILDSIQVKENLIIYPSFFFFLD